MTSPSPLSDIDLSVRIIDKEDNCNETKRFDTRDELVAYLREEAKHAQHVLDYILVHDYRVIRLCNGKSMIKDGYLTPEECGLETEENAKKPKVYMIDVDKNETVKYFDTLDELKAFMDEKCKSVTSYIVPEFSCGEISFHHLNTPKALFDHVIENDEQSAGVSDGKMIYLSMLDDYPITSYLNDGMEWKHE